METIEFLTKNNYIMKIMFIKSCLTLVLLLLTPYSVFAQDVAPDEIGMTLTAQEWSKQVIVGWNLGNTMESDGGETAWGCDPTTKKMIHAVKEAGFNAIRIPVRWYQNVLDNSTMEIKPKWLARVKEIVDWALEEDMYVIINSHCEEWLDRNPYYSKQEENNRRLTALWRNIATYFRDYGEKLAFAGTNEVDTDDWAIEHLKEYHSVQNGYNQTFVDAVRSTGGKNYYRHLLVQTYGCIPYHGFASFVIPKDKVEGKLSVEVHIYPPEGYGCLGYEDPNNIYYYWGKKYKDMGYDVPEQDEETIVLLFDRMRKKWWDNGLGVIIGEHGLSYHYTTDDMTTQLENEQYYFSFFVSEARKHGFATFVWDNNQFGNGFDKFGIFNRNVNMIVKNKYALNGIMDGAKTQYQDSWSEPDITEGRELYWEGDLYMKFGNDNTIIIPSNNLMNYDSDMQLVLQYTLDYDFYNSNDFTAIQFTNMNDFALLPFIMKEKEYNDTFFPHDYYLAGSGEQFVTTFTFKKDVFDQIQKQGLKIEGHNIRMNKVLLASTTTAIPFLLDKQVKEGKIFKLDGTEVQHMEKGKLYIKNKKKVLYQ